MKKINVTQLCDQWLSNGSSVYTVNRFHNRSVDFAVKASIISKNYFVDSFSKKSFDGKRWPERESNWGKKFTHPLMLDTATLRDSIKVSDARDKKMASSGSNSGKMAKTFGKRGGFVNIYTTEKTKAEKGKRGINPKSGGSYAAIHNTDPRYHNFKVNQHSDKKPEQRQFIGFSEEVNNKVLKEIKMIFEGLPFP